MTMVTQTAKINLIPSPNKMPVVINVSQFDSGTRTLTFEIYNGANLFTIPNGTTAKLVGLKPDGNVYEGAMTVGANSVSIVIEEQLSIIAGSVMCEVELFDSQENQIGTANFVLMVETGPYDNGTASESSNPTLQRLISGGENGQIFGWKDGGAAWVDQQNILFDDAPMPDSNNAVKSKGIYNSIKDVSDAIYDENDGVLPRVEDLEDSTIAITNAQIDALFS